MSRQFCSLSRGERADQSQTQDGKIRHNLNDNLFIRSTTLLHERSIGLAMPDVPSDRSKGINVTFRKGREHTADLTAVLKDVKTRFPKAKIYLAASGSGGVSALLLPVNIGRDWTALFWPGLTAASSRLRPLCRKSPGPDAASRGR